MTLRATIDSGKWIVEAMTSPAQGGGYTCQISITQSAPEQEFGRCYARHQVFETEAGAVLDGLRAGMKWIELRDAGVFQV